MIIIMLTALTLIEENVDLKGQSPWPDQYIEWMNLLC